MNRGCLVLAGLALVSLFSFGVTLEAINDPEQLTAIPFTPWDFVTYALTALAIVALIRLVRKRDPRKTLLRTWTSRLTQDGGRIRSTVSLNPDGTALIDANITKGGDSRRFATQARWQLLDNKTLHLWGSQTATWKILKLKSWTMITADQAAAGLPVRWTTYPRINVKPLVAVAAAALLPVLIALSLLRSQPSRTIADDPKYPYTPAPHHRLVVGIEP